MAHRLKQAEPDEKWVVIYHRADFDGICCGKIMEQVAKFYGATNVKYFPADYGDDTSEILRELPGAKYVFMLDLCFDEVIAAMNHSDMAPAAGGTLYWIDHHVSAINKHSARVIDGIQIDGVAACRLAYYFFSECFGIPNSGFTTADMFKFRLLDESKFVRLLGEYDVWDHRDSNAVLLQHGLRYYLDQHPQEVDWDLLLSFAPEGAEPPEVNGRRVAMMTGLLYKGKIAKDTMDAYFKGLTKMARLTEWEGLRFYTLNVPKGNSQSFHDIPMEADALLMYRCVGHDVSVSLYHAPGHEHHDLSKIATKYGGGGHKGACGFRMVVGKFFNEVF